MDAIWEHLWQLGTPFGMLGIAIIYFWQVNKALQKVINDKDAQIANLNTELRTFMQSSTDKAYEVINNNNTALGSVTTSFNALREVLVTR